MSQGRSHRCKSVQLHKGVVLFMPRWTPFLQQPRGSNVSRNLCYEEAKDARDPGPTPNRRPPESSAAKIRRLSHPRESFKWDVGAPRDMKQWKRRNRSSQKCTEIPTVSVVQPRATSDAPNARGFNTGAKPVASVTWLRGTGREQRGRGPKFGTAKPLGTPLFTSLPP